MHQWGARWNPRVGYRMGRATTLRVIPNPETGGGRREDTSQVTAKQLEIDENVTGDI